MDLLRAIFGFLLPKDDSIYFDEEEEEYYLSEPCVNLTGDSLNGGEVYNEPDYVANH